MYICALTSVPDKEDVPYDPSPYMKGYKWRQHHVQPQNIEKQIRDLLNDGVQVFINLCDGTPDDPLSGMSLVRTLEKLGAAFTGADSRFFDPTRDEMKNAAQRVSVPTPNWMFVNKVDDAAKVVKRLQFPLLVKPPHGYASMGLRRESRVENVAQLKVQMETAINEFGRALIEEFIEGREFTCLIAENPDHPAKPITFKPVEFIFPEGESFKHYSMKWIEYQEMSVAPVKEPRIEKTLREQTMRVFKALGGNGYARGDYRMDAHGVIYMLEINPNCGIFYPPTEPGSADFSLLHDPVYNHLKFMKLIIHAAQMRQERMIAERMLKRQPRKRTVEVEQMAYT